MVAGPNPALPANFYASLAQVVEQLPCKQKVPKSCVGGGSIDFMPIFDKEKRIRNKGD